MGFDCIIGRMVQSPFGSRPLGQGVHFSFKQPKSTDGSWITLGHHKKGAKARPSCGAAVEAHSSPGAAVQRRRRTGAASRSEAAAAVANACPRLPERQIDVNTATYVADPNPEEGMYPPLGRLARAKNQS
jgi:hypothetical protein